MNNADKSQAQRLAELAGLRQQVRELEGSMAERQLAEAALVARVKQMETARAVTAEIIRELDLSTLLDLITNRAVDLIEAASTGVIFLWDEATQILKPQAWLGVGQWIKDVRLELGEGLVGTVAQSREGLLMADYQQSPNAHPFLVKLLGHTTTLAEPLLYREQLVGVIAVTNAQTTLSFTAQDRELLALFAAQAAVAIENARLFEDSRQRQEWLASILEINQRMATSEDMPSLLSGIAEGAARLVQADGVSVHMRRGDRLVGQYSSATDLASERQLGEGALGLAALGKRPIIIPNIQGDPRVLPAYKTLTAKVGLQSLVHIPIRHSNDIVGVLTLTSKRPRVFTLAEIATLNTYSEQAAIAIENARLIEEVRQQSARLEQANGSLHNEITERKRLESQLRQTQKMEAIGTLAGGIAHDFNNILAGMLGYTELAAFDVTPDSPVWRNLQEVLRAGKRAKGLVQQILAFSRQNEAERKPLKLHLLVKETLTLLRASLPATITIHRKTSEDVGTVLADPTQMHQVLMNLCTNGKHALRDTGGVLEVGLDTVEVEADFVAVHPELQPGPHVCLTVRDNGHGMDAATMERIFDPFFTTKGVGEGTGMGLAVVHGIVANHGGAITVQSRSGHGTTFTIYLPRLDGETTAETPSQEVALPGKGSILFVDDEVMLARLGQAMLARLGYQVAIRTSSLEALEAFRAAPHRFDLVITDQTMSHMTGDQLAREIRCIRPDIPIILCTGFSHTIDAATARAKGIDAFLMKPLVARDLSQAIQQVLAQHHSAICNGDLG